MNHTSPISDVTFTKDYRHIKSLRKAEPSKTTPTDTIDGEELKWVQSKLQQEPNSSHDMPTSSNLQEPNTHLADASVDHSPHYDTPSNIPVRGEECAVQDKATRSLSPPPPDAKNYNTGVSPIIALTCWEPLSAHISMCVYT